MTAQDKRTPKSLIKVGAVSKEYSLFCFQRQGMTSCFLFPSERDASLAFRVLAANTYFSRWLLHPLGPEYQPEKKVGVWPWIPSEGYSKTFIQENRHCRLVCLLRGRAS